MAGGGEGGAAGVGMEGMNCSSAVVSPSPAELVRETGGAIVILYCYTAIVVLATLALYIKYVSSPALTERSEHVRTKLRDLNTQNFLLALFSSVSVFLPASHTFSSSVLKLIFGGGMVHFLQLTMLQLGGEVKLVKMEEVKVRLGSVPLCCLAPFTCTTLPITPARLAMVNRLVSQVPVTQFTILYILMSMELSGVEASTPVASLLTTVGTLSWLGGIWGLGILARMVGGALASTQLLLGLGLLPCTSPLLPPPNLAVIGESCVILLACLLMAVYQYTLYIRHSSLPSAGIDRDTVIVDNLPNLPRKVAPSPSDLEKLEQLMESIEEGGLMGEAFQQAGEVLAEASTTTRSSTKVQESVHESQGVRTVVRKTFVDGVVVSSTKETTRLDGQGKVEEGEEEDVEDVDEDEEPEYDFYDDDDEEETKEMHRDRGREGRGGGE